MVTGRNKMNEAHQVQRESKGRNINNIKYEISPKNYTIQNFIVYTTKRYTEILPLNFLVVKTKRGSRVLLSFTLSINYNWGIFASCWKLKKVYCTKGLLTQVTGKLRSSYLYAFIDPWIKWCDYYNFFCTFLSSKYGPHILITWPSAWHFLVAQSALVAHTG